MPRCLNCRRRNIGEESHGFRQKWCSEIGIETSNIEIGNDVETHVFPGMEGHEFFF